MAEVAGETAVNERALYAKISWRLIPYMFLLYIVAYMDRVNVGFAAMDMQRALRFSNTVYGTGAGMFFLGYASGNLPSGLMLQRVGTRRWIAWTMMAWGVVSACMVLVRSAGSFYTLRFLLGIAEAGFVPGMLLYLTFWFPSHQRAKAVAKFMTATSLAGVVGGPLSSALLKLNGVGGLSGWQWLFLFEGMTTLLVGSSVLSLLRDGPDQAKWLEPEEKLWLRGELQRDREMYGAPRQEKFSDAFKLPVVWALAGVYVVIQIGVYVVNLWMPLMLSSLTRGGTDSSLIARIFDTAISSGCDLHRDRGVEFGSMEREARTSCGVHGVGGSGVCVGGGCREYSGGVVCDVAGGDWAVQHDGAVLGVDDSDGWRCGSGWRGCDYYDDGGGRRISGAVCDGTAAGCYA